jgi:hypothetical protein
MNVKIELAPLNDTDRDSSSWYVLRTYNRQEMAIGDFLSRRGLELFIPFATVERTVGGQVIPSNTPILRNIIFVHGTLSADELKDALVQCSYPSCLLKNRADNSPFVVDNQQIEELRSLCMTNVSDAIVSKLNSLLSQK